MSMLLPLPSDKKMDASIQLFKILSSIQYRNPEDKVFVVLTKALES